MARQRFDVQHCSAALLSVARRSVVPYRGSPARLFDRIALDVRKAGRETYFSTQA